MPQSAVPCNLSHLTLALIQCEKSSHALHDETIRKVVSFEKWLPPTLGKSKPQSQSPWHHSSSRKSFFLWKTERFCPVLKGNVY